MAHIDRAVLARRAMDEVDWAALPDGRAAEEPAHPAGAFCRTADSLEDFTPSRISATLAGCGGGPGRLPGAAGGGAAPAAPMYGCWASAAGGVLRRMKRPVPFRWWSSRQARALVQDARPL
ncbi:MAG: hypothetical protein ACLT5P_03235 [Flavonifractor plautii]